MYTILVESISFQINEHHLADTHQHKGLRITEKEQVDMVHLRVGPLVRATSASSTVIWAESSQACEVTFRAEPHHAVPEDAALCITTRTVTVGGRHYAAPQLHGLQPATYYRYHLSIVANNQGFVEEPETAHPHESSLSMHYFRTLDASTTIPQKYYPHEHLGIVDGQMEVVSRTTLQREQRGRAHG